MNSFGYVIAVFSISADMFLWLSYTESEIVESYAGWL